MWIFVFKKNKGGLLYFCDEDKCEDRENKYTKIYWEIGGEEVINNEKENTPEAIRKVKKAKCFISQISA